MVSSLYSSSEFLDVLWDDSILPSIIYLREEISDKDLFENKAEIHKVTYGVMFFFSAIETEIENLKKQLEHANKKFNGEPENPSSKEREGQVTHFKHDHIHRFENSIQEKDIVIKHTTDDVRSQKPTSTQLYLTSHGALYRNPKDKWCYNLTENSDRHKIVTLLAERKDFVQSKELCAYLQDKNTHSLGNEMGKIKNNVREMLGLEDFIEGKKGSGYKLNYPITLIKD